MCEFIDFIIDNNDLKNLPIESRENSYKELNNLLNNTYYESNMYKRDKRNQRDSEAYILSFFNDLSALIKSCYKACFCLKNNIPLPDFYAQIPSVLIKVASKREFANYKFDSLEDIETTNDMQIIRMFLDDIDRWDNKKEPN